MARATGALLLQGVAVRIMARYLERAGHPGVTTITGRPGDTEDRGVDITYGGVGGERKIKVKPDPYFGTDPTKVFDRARVFYRSDAGHYAFESIANNATRQTGWMFNSDADDLYYYYLALSQAAEDIQALLSEPDGVFFSELQVERDELHIMPMRETQAWFKEHYDAYTPRPVVVGDHSAWYRLVPRGDLEVAVTGIRSVGPVFASLQG